MKEEEINIEVKLNFHYNGAKDVTLTQIESFIFGHLAYINLADFWKEKGFNTENLQITKVKIIAEK